MDPTGSMRRYVEPIHELEQGEGRATTPRLKSFQATPPQKPQASRGNNSSLVAAHPTGGGSPEAQRRHGYRPAMFLAVAIL